MNMKTITNIAVFDDDKYFLAMLKGYCYANKIAMAEFEFNIEGINEAEKLKPVLIIIPLDYVNSANKQIETALLKRVHRNGQVKICCLIKNSADIISSGLSGWIDVIINNPFDIGEIDDYLKKTFILNGRLIEDRRHGDRRSVFITEKQHSDSNSNGNDGYDDGYKENKNPGCQNETGNSEFKDFLIDHRNKCVILKGHKVYLTPKEFELVELLSTDIDRIFMADEIINHLWPENNRATKADLYQYMHLLRKKIEQDPNNPQWIMNVKGFGYKLNLVQQDDDYSFDLSNNINQNFQTAS
ncbi:MAG: winged helix-turn-helix domain-containing protein [Methylococcaceae bacterium]